MYSALRAEMYRSKKTITSLSNALGISEKTLRNKLNGDTAFTWPEAQTIHRLLNPKMDIDVMFQRDDERTPEDDPTPAITE